jgi:hypothetical protein
MSSFVQVRPESFDPPTLPADTMTSASHGGRVLVETTPTLRWPASLKQRLRRCCRLKGSLSMESHSMAIQVNGIRIVADVEPRVLRTRVAQTEVDEDVDGSYTKEPNRA